MVIAPLKNNNINIFIRRYLLCLWCGVIELHFPWCAQVIKFEFHFGSMLLSQ